MITYKYDDVSGKTKVYLERKLIGYIKGCYMHGRLTGYRYYPKGNKIGGELFSSLNACKLSLG